MNDKDLELITPNLSEVPEDTKAEPKNANVEHVVSEDDIEAQA